MAQDLKVVIWRFHTATGDVRLNLGAPETAIDDLRSELEGCAVVAESANEFVELAVRAIGNHGGQLGDVLSSPPPIETFENRVRRIASVRDPFEAIDALVALLTSATEEERRRFLHGPSCAAARGYTNSLLYSLDESAPASAQRLVDALATDPETLLGALEET